MRWQGQVTEALSTIGVTNRRTEQERVEGNCASDHATIVKTGHEIIIIF